MCAFNVGHIPCASYLRVERLLRQNSGDILLNWVCLVLLRNPSKLLGTSVYGAVDHSDCSLKVVWP
ncbi:unnamed protein product [Prunus armeniaca]|uniref:Uncharacterized protein n=1 Tax=Prunus armeniaca TaxID=36596 RepID=A0A6J5X6A9_PRUAR|nr:unnamed protein product [Prunus armeniaca]